MRYIQEDYKAKPSKEAKPTPKFGGKGGRTDYSKLSDSKKIISPEGGKR